MNRMETVEWMNSLRDTWRFWGMAALVVGLAVYGYWMSRLVDGVLLGIFAAIMVLFALIMTKNSKLGADL